MSEVTSVLTLNLVAYTNVQQNGKYPAKHLSCIVNGTAAVCVCTDRISWLYAFMASGKRKSQTVNRTATVCVCTDRISWLYAFMASGKRKSQIVNGTAGVCVCTDRISWLYAFMAAGKRKSQTVNRTATVCVCTDRISWLYVFMASGKRKSQISKDSNYFYFKHQHYLLIKCTKWEFITQITDDRIYSTIFQPICV